MKAADIHDYISSGFFPGSACRLQYFVDMNLLCYIQHKQFRSPGVSMESMIASLEKSSEKLIKSSFATTLCAGIGNLLKRWAENFHNSKPLPRK